MSEPITRKENCARRLDCRRVSGVRGLTPFFFALALALFVFVEGCASAPKQVPAPAPAPAKETLTKVEIKDFGLGPGDEIEVKVFRHEDLARKIRVPADGIIFFPLAGELDVSGKGVTGLRRELTLRLSEYVVDPQVSIEVTALRSQKVYVLGEVNLPSAVALEGPVNVVEAVSRAGGFNPNANQESVVLIRPAAGGPELSRLNIEEFLTTGTMDERFNLRPGDVVYVPRTFVADLDSFFGHVVMALMPIITLEQGIAIYPQVEDVLSGRATTGVSPTIVVAPSP